MLDSYIDHIKKTQNRSLIARIYGIYTIKTNYFDPVDIVVMQNTVKLSDKKNHKLTFDIKGSTINRKVNFEEKFWMNQLNHKKVMKDTNYLEINKDLN